MPTQTIWAYKIVAFLSRVAFTKVSPAVAKLVLSVCTLCHPGDHLILNAMMAPGPMPVAADA